MSSGLTLATHFDVLAELPVPVVLVEVADAAEPTRAWANARASMLLFGECRSSCKDWTTIDPGHLERAGLPMARVCAMSAAEEAATSVEAELRHHEGVDTVRFAFSRSSAPAGGRKIVVGVGTEIRTAEPQPAPDLSHILAEIEKLALIGHYVEYPQSGRVEWSPGLERIRAFGADRKAADFAELSETVYPEDAVLLAAREADQSWRRTSTEFRVIRPDGSVRNIFRSCSREVDATGKILRVLGIEQDITEFRLAEKELAEARVAAEASSKSKAEFLAHMSHELRTPLNAIKGFSEVMAQQLFGELSERYLDYINQVHKSAEDLWLRIDYILDLARIEDGQYELGKEHVDLGGIVTEVTGMMGSRAKEKDIAIEVHAKGPEHFWAEKRALKTIVYNLVDNALKFTKPGGAVSIETGMTGAGDAFLRVKDTGVGIPERDVNRVCDAFFQSRAGVEAAGESGTGLGLSITKSLIDLHEGRIDIASEVGKGSTFTVHMPMRSYSFGCAPLAGVRRA